MALEQKIPKEEALFDALAFINMIESPACTYSAHKRSHIAQNTAFDILFKGKHPLDIISALPEEIKETLANDTLTSRTTFRNIVIEDKRFSSIQILPFYRDYLLKFNPSRSFVTDYKQIFQIIYDKSPLGILLIDKNLRIIAANEAVSKMTGYSLDELKQRTFVDLTHPDDLDKNIPLTKKLYSEEMGSVSVQKRYIKKDGSVIWVNLVTSLTKDLNGEFLGGVGIVEDITNRLTIEKQRDELLDSLREKNKEVIDSLIYARSIQNALLPTTDQLNKFFPKHFIYYHPRDIVGGDFYWIRSTENKVYFAVADCTGHGVPGAFISLIGTYRLNMVFEKYRDNDPSILLEKLNNIIAYSFRNPYYTVSHHGMDIAMCCYDQKTGILEYAGANNSMLLIRKGVKSKVSAFLQNEQWYRFSDEDMLEVRADKHAIGSYSKDIKFKCHAIQVKKGDRIYLFSDGYADQFGGVKAKKLKMIQFKSLLLSHLSSDIKKQKNILHDFRASWQGDLQQVDDICVLGIEF